MAVDVDITTIGSGYNRSVIDTNFSNIQEALQEALSRTGDAPNQMETDIDLNSNDLLNVADIHTTRLFVDGEEFVSGDVTAVGDKGWSPSFAVVTDGSRRVLQLTGYVGGEGTEPTDDVGKYVGATQMETLIANGVDIRGAQGASGAGSGDMLAAQNLNDVASKPTAFSNIKQDATESATGVVELATVAEAEAGVDTTRAVTAAGVAAAIAAIDVGDVVLLDSGSLVGAGSFKDFILSSYTDYHSFKIVLSNVTPSSDNNTVSLRVGNGSADSGASDYGYVRFDTFSTSSSGSVTNQTSHNEIQLVQASSVTNFDGEINIIDPHSNRFHRISADLLTYNSSTNYVEGSKTYGFRKTSKVIDRVRLKITTLTFSSGTYKLYGYKA